MRATRLQGQFGRRHHARLVGHANPTHIGSHVRQYKVPPTCPDARTPMDNASRFPIDLQFDLMTLFSGVV